MISWWCWCVSILSNLNILYSFLSLVANIGGATGQVLIRPSFFWGGSRQLHETRHIYTMCSCNWTCLFVNIYRKSLIVQGISKLVQKRERYLVVIHRLRVQTIMAMSDIFLQLLSHLMDSIWYALKNVSCIFQHLEKSFHGCMLIIHNFFLNVKTFARSFRSIHW